MSWSRIARAWQQRFAMPAAESQESVDEELMFHLRSLIDENLAKGMQAEAAWHDAQTRFGSLRRYADDCRQTYQRGHFAMQKLTVAAVLLLGVLMAWVAVEVRALRDAQQLALAAARRENLDSLSQATALARDQQERYARLETPDGEAPVERCDLEGMVVDRDGGPLGNAHVLVVLKTWPDGWYHQDNFATTSDAKGRFRLPKLLPIAGHREVLVAAVKNGFALTSLYQEKWVEAPPAVEPMVLKLDDAADVTVVVLDRGGRPVPRASVVPAFRRTSGGTEHLVYLQASKPIRAVSNHDGRVDLGCFQRGDEAEVWIRVPGGEWERRAMTVRGDGQAITLSTDEPAQETDG